MDDLETGSVWNYKYYAVCPSKPPEGAEKIIWCNSLRRLKREIRDRRWSFAYIGKTENCCIYTDRPVDFDEIRYKPRIRRDDRP
ncbi:hypothetical protein HFQ13_03165 [Acidithiobacillus sp. VAN18-1]|jgi:hypothetical protein|uniref:Uncharacterized protein n=1 Tax=Igneacidithiobacillus copahuensis TaxID=2724909 RepID=A0AAE3CIY6_9PROT|nr:hypothetical protein [Igneacidithiobacillus copahuensis]